MLFTIITFFLCHIIVSLIVPSFASIRQCQSIIALHIATDIFVRDIRALQNDTYHWKLITPQQLVWTVGDHDIGWSFSANRLERKEGIYDKGWKKNNTSIVASGITHAVFTAERVNNKVIGIELILTPAIAHSKPVVCYVATRQGSAT